jgi:hypothetical protein
MSKLKNFIISKKIAKFMKSQADAKIPDQGCYVTLYNNMYKVLTKSDSKICILEDHRANKFAIPREKLAKLLSELERGGTDLGKSWWKEAWRARYAEKQSNANPPSAPSAGHSSGSSGSSSGEGSGHRGRHADPIGTVRNGRKKIIGPSGQPMWVSIASGIAYEHHEGEYKPQDSPTKEHIEAQFKDMLTRLKEEKGIHVRPEDEGILKTGLRNLLEVRVLRDNAYGELENARAKGGVGVNYLSKRAERMDEVLENNRQKLHKDIEALRDKYRKTSKK